MRMAVERAYILNQVLIRIVSQACDLLSVYAVGLCLVPSVKRAPQARYLRVFRRWIQDVEAVYLLVYMMHTRIIAPSWMRRACVLTGSLEPLAASDWPHVVIEPMLTVLFWAIPIRTQIMVRKHACFLADLASQDHKAGGRVRRQPAAPPPRVPVLLAAPPLTGGQVLVSCSSGSVLCRRGGRHRQPPLLRVFASGPQPSRPPLGGVQGGEARWGPVGRRGRGAVGRRPASHPQS